jgi:uracil-DNA glycosylase
MGIQIAEGWKSVLKQEFDEPYFQQLIFTLKTEKSRGETIYPPGSLIFNAFNTTDFDQIKVVILGQDPYHGPGQAHGLSFSVPKGIKPPPSLVNIFKEIQSDLGIPMPKTNGNLQPWAEQGVLLLNATLTVKANQPNSHSGIGWASFTDKVIQILNNQKSHLVFMLWGNFAKEKCKLVDTSKHLVLQSAHPSPFSVEKGFYGCRHFSKANQYLVDHGLDPIDWKIQE